MDMVQNITTIIEQFASKLMTLPDIWASVASLPVWCQHGDTISHISFVMMSLLLLLSHHNFTFVGNNAEDPVTKLTVGDNSG